MIDQERYYFWELVATEQQLPNLDLFSGDDLLEETEKIRGEELAISLASLLEKKLERRKPTKVESASSISPEDYFHYTLDYSDHTYTLAFRNFTDMINMAEYGESELSDNRRGSRNRLYDNWSGASFSEAVYLARHGWSDGAKQIKANLDIDQSLLPKQYTRPQLIMSQVGPGTLDMGRYIAHHPEPWITYMDIESEYGRVGDTVAIAFNISASSGVDKHEMFSKGAVVCALIDLLESLGKRVELTVVQSVLSSLGNNFILKALIKDARDPLDLDRIAFTLAHSGFLRRIIFSIEEQMRTDIRNQFGFFGVRGYGHPYSAEIPGDLNIAASSLLENYKPKQVEQWMREQLKIVGVEWEI